MAYNPLEVIQIAFTLDYVGLKGHRVYILIDEYDNFTNTISSTAGQSAHQALTHGAGVVHLTKKLKRAVNQTDSNTARIPITGVSPITIDDITSNQKIGQTKSSSPTYNSILGFTQQKLQKMLAYHRNEAGLAVFNLAEGVALHNE